MEPCRIAVLPCRLICVCVLSFEFQRRSSTPALTTKDLPLQWYLKADIAWQMSMMSCRGRVRTPQSSPDEVYFWFFKSTELNPLNPISLRTLLKAHGMHCLEIMGKATLIPVWKLFVEHSNDLLCAHFWGRMVNNVKKLMQSTLPCGVRCIARMDLSLQMLGCSALARQTESKIALGIFLQIQYVYHEVEHCLSAMSKARCVSLYDGLCTRVQDNRCSDVHFFFKFYCNRHPTRRKAGGRQWQGARHWKKETPDKKKGRGKTMARSETLEETDISIDW